MPRTSSAFLGQFAWVAAGRLAAAVLQAILLALAARMLLPNDFGLLSAVLGLTSVFVTLADLGISTFVVRERASDPHSGLIATALRIQSWCNFGLFILGAIALVLAGVLLNPVYLLMIPLALWMTAERSADIRLSIVFADGDAKVNSINLVARRTLAIALLLAFSALGLVPILAYSLAVALAAAASAVAAIVYIRPRVPPADTTPVSVVLARSRHFWLNSAATQARNLDVTLVAVVAGTATAGFYAAAARLTSPLRILSTSMASVMLPQATRSLKQGHTLRPLLKVALVTVGGMVLLSIVLIVIAPWGIPLVLGAPYAPAVPAVQAVVASLPFAAAASLFGSMLQGMGRQKYVAFIALTTTICCLAFVTTGAILGGALGAAIGLGLSFVIQTVLLVISFARPSTAEAAE